MSSIILIEHEAKIQQKLLEVLQKAGFTVDLAEDGEQGLKKIKEGKQDLIILDADVPIKNGEKILEDIRTDFDLAFIPVVVITRSSKVDEMKKYLNLGACDTLHYAELQSEVILHKVKKCFSIGGGFLENEESDAMMQGEDAIGKSQKDIKVLIIEDDQFLSELCQTKLSKEGYTTITALDGETGLQKMIEEKPNIVLLDILLPGIDGFEVLRQIKANKDADINTIPVLLLSNYGQEEKIQKGMSLGAVDYLVKANFTTNEIVNKIKSVIGN